MWFTILIGFFLVAVIYKWMINFRRNFPNLDHIPGPKRSIWNKMSASQGSHTKITDPYKRHLLYEEMRSKYGPIFKIANGPIQVVTISDYETIYEVTVKSGREFGGRFTNYKLKEVIGSTGILMSYEPNEKWKTLRKISHKHLRQFGDGLSRLESIIGEISDDMFAEFSRSEGMPMDPSTAVFDTALNSIVFLITGERTRSGEALVEDMREYEDLFLTTAPMFAPLSFKLLQLFHWMRYLGFDQWKPFQRFCYLHRNIWERIKAMHESNTDSQSICRVLQGHIFKEGDVVDESDARSTALSLLLAGVTTTSATFRGAINILAHNPDIQVKIYREIEKVVGEGGGIPSLSDRPRMPYSRAVLYELLRYTSVVAHGVTHRAVQDTTLHGYRIPTNTAIEISIWNLHHNEGFWENPYEFSPERFLDESGDVVPADHPNRKHLMPFGAGTRVCLGESLAMARLFLWLTSLVAQFEVQPAPGNLKSSTDARNFSFEIVLKPTKYEVIFKGRK